jgi:hypothetical protein
MKKINKPPKLYRDKTYTEDICAKKYNYHYKTRSVSKAIANTVLNIPNTVNTVSINPSVLKTHKYIPNLKNSISNVRKNINIKNLRIKIPTNT